MFRNHWITIECSNTYYTTGENDIIFIKIGSNKILFLDNTYHLHMNIFQNYSINEHTNNNCDLFVILNGTSNEYDLQSFYDGRGFIGVIHGVIRGSKHLF